MADYNDLSDLGGTRVAQSPSRNLANAYDLTDLGGTRANQPKPVDLKTVDMSDLGTKVAPPKSYSIKGDQVQFSLDRPADGLEQAVKDGAIDPKWADAHRQKFVDAQVKYQELSEAAGDAQVLKALIHGGGTGTAFLLSSIPGAKGGAALGTIAVGGPEDPLAAITAPVGAALGALTTGTIGAFAFKKGLNKLGDYNDAVRSLVASAELHPVADTAGELVAFAASAPKSIANLARLGRVATAAGESAPRAIGAQVLKGGAAGLAFEGILRPTFDAGRYLVADQLGIEHDKWQAPNTQSLTSNVLLGILTAGHSLQFREYTGAEVANLVMRAKARESAGIPMDANDPAAVIKGFQNLGADERANLQKHGLLDPLTPDEIAVYAKLKDQMEQMKQSGLLEENQIAELRAEQASSPGIGKRKVPLTSAVVGLKPKEGGSNAADTVRQPGGVPSEPRGIAPVGQTQPEAGAGDRVPGPAGEPPKAPIITPPPATVPPAAPAPVPPVAQPPATTLPPTMETARKVITMSPQEFVKNAGSFNKINLEIGRNATPAEYEELKRLREQAVAKHQAALKESADASEALSRATNEKVPAQEFDAAKKRLEDSFGPVSAYGSLPQFYTEAIKEYERVRAAGEPTPAQREAGNYPKEKVKFNGLNLTIETKRGEIRRNKPGQPVWEVTMPADYGQILGTKGKDGDPVDIYMGPNPQSQHVFVIDQQDADTKKFDEHKVMAGFDSPQEAIQTYLQAFSDGRGSDRFRNITPMLVDQFKTWLKNGDMTKPMTEGKTAAMTPEQRIEQLLFDPGTAAKKAVALKKLAKDLGVSLKQAQEMVEARLVHIVDSILHDPNLSPKQKFDEIVRMYQNQPVMSARTSTSVANQAYSTPAPLAYALSYAAGVTTDTPVYDPTAGHGMLMIGSDRPQDHGNEINKERAALLKQFVGTVTVKDATKFVPERQFHVIMTNPPFGTISNVNYQGFGIKRLEHIIALRALEAMMPNGSAGIILGAKREEGEGGKGAQWVFENYLYGHFNVVANFEVAGELYGKQGTKWPVRVLVVSGRKATPQTGELAPKDVARLTSWDDIWAQAQVIHDAVERNRPSVVSGGTAGVPVPPVGAPAAPENAGTVPPASSGSIQPSAGGRQPEGTGPSQPTSPAKPPRRGTSISAKRSGQRPNVPQRPSAQPVGGGNAPAGVEAGVPAGSPPAAPAGTGGSPAAPANVPGNVPRPPAVDVPAGADITAMTEAELDALLDQASGELAAGTPAPETAPQPEEPPTRTAADIAAEAAKLGVKGIDDAVQGLHDLFGGGAHMGSTGPGFDESTYAKAKPHFQSAYENFKKAGKTLKEFFKFIFEKFGERIRPYLKRFMVEKQGEQKANLPKQAPAVPATEFQSVYVPRAAGVPFGTLTPKNIAGGEFTALDKLQARVGPLTDFVANRLNMTPAEVSQVMAAEQIDGVALAIDQIEQGGALVIGDETGIGKGRQGAAIIRYAMLNGIIPVFFTKDPKLFTDMFGDLNDINTQVRPFILGDPGKASIVDSEGNVIHRAPAKRQQDREMQRILGNGMAAAGYNAIFVTYSQINVRNDRQMFLEALTAQNPSIIVLDEAHEAAGDNETSMQAAFISGGTVIRGSGANLTRIALPGLLNAAGTQQGQGGVTYLSATYAKRPENMPVYFRTALSLAADSFDQIVDAMTRGGVALQQAVSEALSQAGQYVRRERDFTGVSYDMKRIEVADQDALVGSVDEITDVLSEIVRFSGALREIVKDQGGSSTAMTETQIDMTDFAAIVHNQVSQLLLAAKADTVVSEAIAAHRAGEKPVIALMNTMESFLSQYVEDRGIKPGDEVIIRWNELLRYALSRTLRVTEKLPNGDTKISTVDPADYGMAEAYRQIDDAAKAVETKFPISPIDYIIQRCNAAGVRMVELTGRESGLKYTNFETGAAVYNRFKKANKNQVVNGFNSGLYDGMLLNASGSTGLSAHASVKFKDQKPRHMLIAQAALDINVFVQTLGRIKRTGMVMLGIGPAGAYGAKYSHLVLPLQAELRPAAMAARKMKSLNANTTAEADNAIKIDAEDIFNRYGDQIVAEYLDQHEDLQHRLNLQIEVKDDGSIKIPKDVARKFTGRIALMPDAEQESAYNEILPAYRSLIEQLKATGEYDLEIVVHSDWDGVMRSDEQLSAGTDESNIFTAGVRVQQWEVRDSRHVPTGKEMRREFERNTGGAQKLGDKWRGFQNDVEEKFRERGERLTRELAEAKAKNTDDGKVEAYKLESQLQTHAEQKRKWEDTRKLVHHIIWNGGQVCEISNAETGEYYDGMLVESKFPNLAAGSLRLPPSGFKFKFMVDAPGGVLYITAGQIGPDKWAKDDSNKTMDDLKGGNRGARYDRFVVVGNPIRGYEATGGKGKMVRFASREGSIVTGLLMPRNWGPENLANDPRLDLATGKAVHYFLVNHGQTGYRDYVPVEAANIVRIQRAYGSAHTYLITTPSAKKTGGQVYLDDKLLKITGDFTKSGNRMAAEVDERDLAAAADRIQKILEARFRPVGKTETMIPKVNESNQRTSRQGSALGEAPSAPTPERPPVNARGLQELRAALPSSGLSPEHQRLIQAFMDSPLAPQLEGLRFHIADAIQNGWQGSYFEDLVEIARTADPLTGPEELLHKIWETLPDDIQAEFERMRVATIEEMIKETKNPLEILALEEMRDNPIAGGDDFVKREFPRSIRKLVYPVASASEFFAQAGSQQFQKRVGALGAGFWERVKEMVKNFIAALKKALGWTQTQEQWFRNILEGNYRVRPETAEKGARSKEPQASIPPEQRAAREEAIKEGEEEGRIPTRMFGEEYYVLDRERITPESIAASSAVAKEMLDKAGIIVTEQVVPEPTTGEERQAWIMTPGESAEVATTKGEALREMLLKEFQTQREAPKTADRLGNIINTIRINFELGNKSLMGSMDPGTRLELFSMAQSEASYRGAALGALAGYSHDMVFVGRNVDVVLGRIWSDALGGDAIRRLVDELKQTTQDRDALVQERESRIAELEQQVAALTESLKQAMEAPAPSAGEEPVDRTAEVEALKEQLSTLTKELVKARLDLEDARVKTDDLERALATALKRVPRKLARELKPGGRLGKRLVEMIQKGEGEPWDIIREIARSKGWKIPTDEDLEKMRTWADQLDRLQHLNPREAEMAGNTPAEREQARRMKSAATQAQQAAIRKKLETMWERLTRPWTMRNATGRMNIIMACSDYVSANLLLKAGFATRQVVDIATQGAMHTPTRACQAAIKIHMNEVEAGRRQWSDMHELWRDLGDTIGQAYRQRTKALRASMRAAAEVLAGTAQGRNVGRLFDRVNIFDRAMQKADELKAAGRTTEAALLRIFTFMRLGYTVAQALDNLHGLPAVYQEMRQQVLVALREQGRTRAEAEVKADWVMGDMNAEWMNAIPETQEWYEANGLEGHPHEIKAAAWRLVMAKQYERMRALHLPADDFEARNDHMLNTIGWNQKEVGGVGGFFADILRGGAKLAGQIASASPVTMPLAIPLVTLTRFGNAIGILINRKLSCTPLGFYPGAFGVNESEIDPHTGIAHGGSPWYWSEEDRRQRKVEASAWTTFQIMFFLLAATGAIVVRLRWPRDKEERELWDRMGWKPGQVDLPVGDGKHITMSLNTGPLVLMSPGISAGGAVQDLMTDRAKQQQRLNDEAARKGLKPGSIRPISTADLLGVAASAAWGSITTGRTVSGLLSTFTDYGIPNVSKTVAGVFSPIVPALPAWQELMRMQGVNLDARMAGVWDFMFPTPSSGAARVNMLGDKVGDANDLQRVVQILTGGNYPFPVSDAERQSEVGYQTLFASGYRPPSISPNRGYNIRGENRPFTDAELTKYTQLRGEYFKQELAALGPTDDPAAAKAAFQRANRRALDAMGVSQTSGGGAQSGATGSAGAAAGRIAPLPVVGSSLGRRPTLRGIRPRAGYGRIGRGRTRIRGASISRGPSLRPRRPLSIRTRTSRRRRRP